MLSIMILSIVICCAILGISMKGYYKYLTEEQNQEILKKEKEELRQKEEQERQDRLAKEEQERQDRLDKEERDWSRQLQLEEIHITERAKNEEYKNKYNETHLTKTISFDELMDSINFIIARVWSHEEHYYLKANDIVIPKIEEESIKFGGMVLNHMSPELRKQALLYYSFDGLLYYIHSTFNDFIWEYAMERNELQGVYQYLYSNNRAQLKKDIAEARENSKSERSKSDGKKKAKYANFEEYFNDTQNNEFY